MDNKNEKKEPCFTGWYAVVHFGKDEKDGTPCYLEEIPYQLVAGGIQTTYKHFTFNLRKAALFPNTVDADFARQQVEKTLAEENHCLAGHVKVMEIRGIIRNPGGEEA